jgi:hypothetical protein
MLLFLLLACEPDDPTDTSTEACVEGEGELEVCVFLFADSETGVVGGHVEVRENEAATWIDALTDSSGCAQVSLAAGAWEVRASDANRSCVTPEQAVTIESCETTSLRIDVGDWCVDG